MAARLRVKSAELTQKDACIVDVWATMIYLSQRPCVRGIKRSGRVAQIGIKISPEASMILVLQLSLRPTIICRSFRTENTGQRLRLSHLCKRCGRHPMGAICRRDWFESGFMARIVHRAEQHGLSWHFCGGRKQ